MRPIGLFLRASIVGLILAQGTAWAGDVPQSFAELQVLLQRAGEAREAGRLDEALQLNRKALQIELPAAEREVYGYVRFEIACIEAKRGRKAQALQALKDAVGAGFLDLLAIQTEPALGSIRSSPQMKAIVAMVKEQDRRRRPFLITGWKNPDLQWAELHRFSLPDAPASKALREKWRLDEIVAGKRTELDQQLALAAWVHNRWRHGSLDQPSKADAETILTEAEQGRHFRCVEYSITLTEVLQAVGFPARTIRLRMDGASYGVGKGHVVTEVWSNELEKWFVIDGQNNATWRSGEKLLDAAEVRELLLAKKTNALRMALGPSSWRTWAAAFDEPAQRADWVRYFHALSYRFDNRREGSPDLDEASVALTHPATPYEPVFQGAPSRVRLQTEARARLYPELNRVHFDLMTEGKFGAVSNVLTLKLSHSAPWFSRYLIVSVADGNAVEQREDLFRWKLRPGENRLDIQEVDSFGRVGPVSSVALTYQGPALPQ